MIVFHPTWSVPDGIKAKELGPILRKRSGGGLFGIFGGGYSANAVLEAYQLRAYVNATTRSMPTPSTGVASTCAPSASSSHLGRRTRSAM